MCNVSGLSLIFNVMSSSLWLSVLFVVISEHPFRAMSVNMYCDLSYRVLIIVQFISCVISGEFKFYGYKDRDNIN